MENKKLNSYADQVKAVNANPFNEANAYAFAATIAASVLKRLTDPQSCTAVQQGALSDSGFSPAIVKARRDMQKDIALLKNTLDMGNKALTLVINDKKNIGIKWVNTVNDDGALKAWNKLTSQSIGDGLPVINAAYLAIMEAAHKYYEPGKNWLEEPVKIKKPKRRVYKSVGDTILYTTVNIEPIRLIYRAVRKSIEDNANKAAIVNGYTYVSFDDYFRTASTVDAGEIDSGFVDSRPIDDIYYRLGKYADVGGMTAATHGKYAAYATDAESAVGVDILLSNFNLTSQQVKIAKMLTFGASVYKSVKVGGEYVLRKRWTQSPTYTDIALLLGVSEQTIINDVRAVRRALYNAGMAPKGYVPGVASNAKRVIAISNDNGAIEQMFDSVKSAAKWAQVECSDIRRCCDGKRRTAGGYRWSWARE